MSNKNPGNWKNKLEDVGSLPGETVTDKNAAWEKLHSRLSRKPRRVKPVWYQAAAACLLFAMIIPVFTINNKKTEVVKNDLPKIGSPETTVNKTSPLKENTVVIISPSLIYKKKTIPHALPTGKQAKAETTVQKEEMLSANINDENNSQPQTTLLPAVINTPVEVIAAPVAVKKKLKVVHVNELTDEQGSEILSAARYYEHQPFKLKLIGQQVYPSSSITANNNGFTIFKSKSIPSN